MNKMTIIWLTAVSVILLIVVTVLITLGASKHSMMRGGQRGAKISTGTEQVVCSNCKNETGIQEGKGMKRGQGLKQGEGITVKDTTTVTPAIPAN